LKNTKKGNCLDCLYCKVSAKSTENLQLCYCGMAENAQNRQEPYWAGRKVCSAFENMAERSASPPKAPRKLLLKNTGFLSGLSRRQGVCT
jgi:hypothetical protein